MDINQRITEELGVKRWQVDAAIKLIDEGNTIPFIARYRKKQLGRLMMSSFAGCTKGCSTLGDWKRKRSRCSPVLRNREN